MNRANRCVSSPSPNSARTKFRLMFCRRVRALREAHGITQVEMAAALGVGHEAYRSYETRVLLPHHLIVPFAQITGADIAGLYLRRPLRERRREASTSFAASSSD